MDDDKCERLSVHSSEFKLLADKRKKKMLISLISQLVLSDRLLLVSAASQMFLLRKTPQKCISNLEFLRK